MEGLEVISLKFQGGLLGNLESSVDSASYKLCDLRQTT